MIIVGIMVGGALGALSRYGVTLLVQHFAQYTPLATFPLGTMLVNVAGSFLLALLLFSSNLSPLLKATIGTGFLGSFTTFSTFEVETFTLIQAGFSVKASLYVLGSILAGFLGVVLGRLTALSFQPGA